MTDPQPNPNDTPLALQLTEKQRQFVLHWVAMKNGTKAAKAAGYEGSDAVLASVASENLRNPKIRAYIGELLKDSAASAAEVLERLTEQATPSMDDFLTIDSRGRVKVDLKKAEDRRKLHLIQEVKYDRQGRLQIKLIDPLKSQELLARYHALLTDNVNHSGEIGVKGYTMAASPDDWDDEPPPPE